MAITIINPAQFNSGGGNSIRSAFNTEGYGVSTSFLAYAQGAGIVPATSAFNAIGAGTAGDPLQMSQFSGFVVPSIVTFSPVGDPIFANRPILEAVDTETTVQIIITASSSVTWNWTGSGGSVGFPATVSVVNGGSASSIQFSLPWNGNFTTSAAFEVEAANRYWRVELQMETYD